MNTQPPSYREEVFTMARLIDRRCKPEEIPCLAGLELLRFAELLDQRGTPRADSPGRRAIDQTNLASLVKQMTELQLENARLKNALAERETCTAWAEEVLNEMFKAFQYYGMAGFWGHCATVLNHLAVEDGKVRLAVKEAA